jgi:hypothetical protein
MFLLHGRSLAVPVYSVAPAITGSAISGQVLTASAGTATASVETEYRWSTATPPYTTYTLAGVTATTFTLSDSHIDLKLIVETRKRNGDGWSDWVASSPTGIVQDNPAAPLAISGAAPTSVYEDSAYSFIVTALGGTPPYTFTLRGTWPAGATITPLGSAQATIAGPFPTPGNYGGLSVRVTDNAAATADISTFTLSVLASAGIPKLNPGTGWTADLTAATNGTVGNPGYGNYPGVFWADTQYDELTGEAIYEFLTFHPSTQADFSAAGKVPHYGIAQALASLDNGPWQLITGSWDASVRRYNFRLRVSAADYADGVPVITGTKRREIRVRSVPRNGIDGIGQSDPITLGNNCMRFVTNANGTLFAGIKYVSGSGSDTTGNGTSGSPYRTLEKATQALAAANGGNPGGGTIRCKAGNYKAGNAAALYADNGRFLVVETDIATTDPSAVRITAVDYNGLRAHKTKFRNLTWVPTSGGAMVAYNHATDRYVIFEDCSMDFPASALTANGANLAQNGYIAFRRCTITNTPNAFNLARLVDDCHIGTVASDSFTNSQTVLNSSAARWPTGAKDATTGLDFHGDAAQFSMNDTGNPYTLSWRAGCCFYNVDCGEPHPSGPGYGGIVGQGPFLKDAGYFYRMNFIESAFRLQETARNGLYLHNSGGQVSACKASMFYNVTIMGGYNRWSGTSVDVVAAGLALIGMVGGNNGVPSTMLSYGSPPAAP